MNSVKKGMLMIAIDRGRKMDAMKDIVYVVITYRVMMGVSETKDSYADATGLGGGGGGDVILMNSYEDMKMDPLSCDGM